VQRRRGLSRQTLTIEKGEVRAILIFKQVLAILNENACMQARDATFFSTMWGEIDIGVDIAHGILAAQRNHIFAGEVKLLIIGLNEQASI
jgi:hypothetical protein